jgi:hypothetical protein
MFVVGLGRPNAPTRPFMLSLSHILPAAVLRRPLFRLVSFFLIFVTFLVLFLPPTGISHFLDAPHFPTQHRPLIIPPPDFGPPHAQSHRIKAQRPLDGPDRKEDVWSRRADEVRDAFLHAYKSYLTHAAPHDELRPLSKAPIDKCVLPAPSRAPPLTCRACVQLQRLGSLNY